MSLFPCSSSISMSSLFKLEWTVEISVFFSLNCKCVMCQICWSLTMIVFFGKSISCFDLLMTGILKRWFIPDLKETMVSVVSNPSGSSVSFFSKSIGILLLILPKLTLHWMLISLLAGTMVVLGIPRTKNSSWSVDWLMRLTSALIFLELMSLTLRWSELIRAFSLPVLLTNTFIVMNPKIGLSSGSLITKKGTYNSSTVLLDSSDNSNFRSIHPRNGISVWLPHWSCSLSHGSNSSPTDKILTPGKLLSSHLCDSRDAWATVSSKTCVATSFVLHATSNFSTINWTTWSCSDGGRVAFWMPVLHTLASLSTFNWLIASHTVLCCFHIFNWQLLLQ